MSVENEIMFSTLSFMKTKLQNRLNESSNYYGHVLATFFSFWRTSPMMQYLMNGKRPRFRI
jgi:hypothetical protein